MVEEKKTEEQKKVVRKRVPLGTSRRKLTVPEKVKKKGYVYRWVNDDGTRVSDFQNAGYDFVEGNFTPGDPDAKNRNTDLGSRVSVSVGKDDAGKPIKAYLMAIEEEYYKEDQEAKQREVDEVEDALRRGTDSQGTPGMDGRYVPPGGIKIGK